MKSETQRIAVHLPAVLLTVGALGLWLTGLGNKGLWYDELQSVTHAALPLGQLVRSVQAADPHPPLYYIQLHFWLLAGSSDSWVRLNSVMYALGCLLLLYKYGRSSIGRIPALTAAILFASAPFVDFYARESRMYAMLMMLAVGCVLALRRLLERGLRLSDAVILILLVEGFLYSHGAGFLIVPGLMAYNVLWYAGRPRKAELLRNGAVWFVAAGLYLPWAMRALGAGGTAHLSMPTAAAVAKALGTLALGFAPGISSVAYAIAVGIGCCILLIGAAASREAMRLVVGLVATPILLAMAVSFLVRPIWDVRTIAWIFPLIALAGAVGIGKAGEYLARLGGGSWRWVCSGIPVLALLFMLVLQRMTFAWPWDIKRASEFLAHLNSLQGITVVVPSSRIYWGLSWYLIGPGSVDPGAPTFTGTTPSGIMLISAPPGEAIELPHPPFWIAYRDREGEKVVLPWVVLRESNIDFAGLRLDYVPPQAQ